MRAQAHTDSRACAVRRPLRPQWCGRRNDVQLGGETVRGTGDRALLEIDHHEVSAGVMDQRPLGGDTYGIIRRRQNLDRNPELVGVDDGCLGVDVST